MRKFHPSSLCPGTSGTFLLLVIVGLLGCRKAAGPLPKTYPVTGKLVASQGQLPQAGSAIQFTPKDMELVAGGRIEADGTFSLAILCKGQMLTGATKGPHYVTLLPLTNGVPGHPISLKEPCTVKPGENHFVVELDGQLSR